ncbi:hypothetical protein ERJ75_000557400 [Trypanosoma vivax]|nr:hypothetical protein ERJ75_000557400 [Trypanosoma vivax]
MGRKVHRRDATTSRCASAQGTAGFVRGRERVAAGAGVVAVRREGKEGDRAGTGQADSAALGGGRRERSELARAEDPARVRPDVPQQRPGTQAVRAGRRRQFCTQQTEVDEKEQKTWGTRSGKVGAGECSVELCVRTTLPLCGGRVERGGGVPYSERKNRQAAMNHASADEARKGWT